MILSIVVRLSAIVCLLSPGESAGFPVRVGAVAARAPLIPMAYTIAFRISDLIAARERSVSPGSGYAVADSSRISALRTRWRMPLVSESPPNGRSRR